MTGVTAWSARSPSAALALPKRWPPSYASSPQTRRHSSPEPSFPWTAAWRWAIESNQPKEHDPMSDELFERFRKTAADSLSKPVDEIAVESNFADDLDADSLDLVQLVMDLEEEFDITVDEEELEGIATVGQAFDLIKSKL